MSTEWKPEETPDCCEVWPQIIGQFLWMKFADYPDFLTMAHFFGQWRVNFCPSCGKDRRSAIIRSERLH